ncbi:hypothetical protein [Ralstonia pseudosolanacearum]|uniref:hypothetical protein n=1 Tax=Ralstonia pseudosolanacearum TaxID=1310165 RepID=UPI003CEF980C
MMTSLRENRKSASAASIRNFDDGTFAHALISDTHCPRLTDDAIAVLARTATDWFASSVAEYLNVSVAHGRICLTGHVHDARSLARLKTALLRMPGVNGLDQVVTVEPTRSLPLLGCPAYGRPFQAE